jgi:amidophosphoribosyltransferase
MFDQIHEECGVFGVYKKDKNSDVAMQTYMALFALQHRGQESCGIAVCDDGLIRYHRDLGLVPDVFTRENLDKVGTGNMAIGHVRYSTTGAHTRANAQPLVVRHIKGPMALAHNGNLVNAMELREELELSGAIFHSTNDTEVISYMITKARLHSPSIEAAVEEAMRHIRGAYSLVVMSPTKLIAVRDPQGFRPLCLGEKNGDIFVASESCALDSLGATFLRDIEPGEIVVVEDGGIRSNKSHCGQSSGLCIFEFIYTARQDSIIEGVSVHDARKRAGVLLAEQYPLEADVVIGIPESGIDAAMGYAEASGIPFGMGFTKNRSVGRTFIQPTQRERERAVGIKLNVISSTVKGKRVVMIDDSIVRGTTTDKIVSMVRRAGATEVHLLIASPPFLYPCYFGTDVDSRENLLACRMTIPQIREHIDADSLGYLAKESVTAIAADAGCGFCTGCFTGHYPIAPPADVKKDKFEHKIGERVPSSMKLGSFTLDTAASL